MVMELINNKKNAIDNKYNLKLRKRKKQKKKEKKKKNKLFNLFNPHLIPQSSSHVTRMQLELPISETFDANHISCDSSTWNSTLIFAEDSITEAEPLLAGYLDWLEKNSESSGGDDEGSDIDRLAEQFIASCHEKFRLEKEESYRRYQEMLARSL